MDDEQDMGKADGGRRARARPKNPWRLRETLSVALLAAALLGVGILFGTSRMRAAWEAREEKAIEAPAHPVVLGTTP